MRIENDMWLKLSIRKTASMTIQTRLRYLPDGATGPYPTPQEDVFTNTGTDPSVEITRYVPLRAGDLLDIIMTTSTTGVARGICFVRAILVYGQPTIGQTNPVSEVPVVPLFSGYLTSSGMLGGNPFGALETPGSGRGVLRSTATNDPVAGAQYNEIGPGDNRLWRLVHFTARIITDATVIDRFPYLRITVPGGGPDPAVVVSSIAIPAAFLGISTFIASGEQRELVVGAIRRQTIPYSAEMFIRTPSTVTVQYENLQAGDNVGVGSVVYEEWVTD